MVRLSVAMPISLRITYITYLTICLSLKILKFYKYVVNGITNYHWCTINDWVFNEKYLNFIELITKII